MERLICMRIVRSCCILAAITILCFGVTQAIARADDSAPADTASTEDAGVARISLLQGNVTMQRGDEGDTIAAAVNAPVNVGDYVTTTSGSRTEVQLDNYNFVRVGSDAQLRMAQLDSDSHKLQLAAGTIELRVLKVSGARPQIDTPSIGIRPDAPGRYRISVNSDGNTFLTVRSGSADLLAPQGTQTISSGVTVQISGASLDPQIRTIATVPLDDFDSWNSQRDEYAENMNNDEYANDDIVGLSDLHEYGHWVWEPDYGKVWVPYDEAADWAPYHDGHWVWEPYYGWTWVAYEPWGWAPYHYGRWFYAAPYGWAWYPGPVYVRPVYRPALVAFFGFGGPGWNVNLAFGNIGWVPLAPYEVFHPWWGPRIVNRTEIVNVTNITNVYNITNVNIRNVYRNAKAPGGVVAISHENFTNGGAYRYLQTHDVDLRHVALAKSALPIVPTHRNLTVAKNAGQPLPPTHLSPRFERFSAPPKLSPTFEQQRSAVQTSTQNFYSAHRSAGTARGFNSEAANGPKNSPKGPSSAWSRFNTSRGSSAPSFTNGAGSARTIETHGMNSYNHSNGRSTGNSKHASSKSSKHRGGSPQHPNAAG